MSNHRRLQSNSGSKNTSSEHHAEKDNEHFLTEEAIMYRHSSAGGYRMTDDPSTSVARPFASTRPAAQSSPGDWSGIQASSRHFGSNPLFPMVFPHALQQGLGTLNTNPRLGLQLSANVDGGVRVARSLILEGRIANSTLQPDTSRLSSPTTSMMVNNVVPPKKEFPLLVVG